MYHGCSGLEELADCGLIDNGEPEVSPITYLEERTTYEKAWTDIAARSGVQSNGDTMVVSTSIANRVTKQGRERYCFQKDPVVVSEDKYSDDYPVSNLFNEDMGKLDHWVGKDNQNVEEFVLDYGCAFKLTKIKITGILPSVFPFERYLAYSVIYDLNIQAHDFLAPSEEPKSSSCIHQWKMAIGTKSCSRHCP